EGPQHLDAAARGLDRLERLGSVGHCSSFSGRNCHGPGRLPPSPAPLRFGPRLPPLRWGGGNQSPAPVSPPSSRTRPGPFRRVPRVPPACCLVLSGWLSKSSDRCIYILQRSL